MDSAPPVIGRRGALSIYDVLQRERGRLRDDFGQGGNNVATPPRDLRASTTGGTR
jgi:hypothetical protein